MTIFLKINKKKYYLYKGGNPLPKAYGAGGEGWLTRNPGGLEI